MILRRRYAVDVAGISMLSGPVLVSPVTGPLLLPAGSVVRFRVSVLPVWS